MSDRSRIFRATAPEIERAAREAARRLTAAGIPHALIGRLAVNAYAPPRTTSDVDFLIPLDNPWFRSAGAGMTKGTTSHAGIDIDLVGATGKARSALEAEIQRAREIDGLPVLAPEWVAFLKLRRGFLNDRAAVGEMITEGSIRAREVRQLIERFGTTEMLKQLARTERDVKEESAP